MIHFSRSRLVYSRHQKLLVLRSFATSLVSIGVLLLTPSVTTAGAQDPVVEPLPSITNVVTVYGGNSTEVDQNKDGTIDKLDGVVKFKVKATDPQGDNLTYSLISWKQDGTAVNLDNFFYNSNWSLSGKTGDFKWTPDNDRAGYQHQITFKVVDSNNHAASVTVEITTDPKQIISTSSKVGGTPYGWINDKLSSGEKIAGLRNVYYSNEDGGHAMFYYNKFPQLSKWPTNTHWYNPRYNPLPEEAVTIRNASVCYRQTESCISVDRYYMEHSSISFIEKYDRNDLSFHPGHVDDGRNGYEPYPMRWNTIHSTLGSSGSEKNDMAAFFYIMAAYKPEVQKELIRKKIIIPVTQAILRYSRVKNDSDYLTGYAHPSIWKDDWDTVAAMDMAYNITTDTIPPIAQISLVSSPKATKGEDYFDSRSPLFANYSQSIATIYRENTIEKSYVVSAEDSYDVNNKSLTYTWKALSNEENITIEPLNSAQSKVRITFHYHKEDTIDDTDVTTPLAIVGAFVNNGSYWSTPAYVTSFSLLDETRTYNSNGKIVEIGYNAQSTQLGKPRASLATVMGNYYDIKDWQPLLEKTTGASGDLANEALQSTLSAAEIQALRDLMPNFVSLKAIWQAAVADQSAKKSVSDAANAAKKEAQSAYDANKSQANLDALNAAKDAYTAAYNAYSEARTVTTATRDAAGTVIVTPLPSVGRSAKDLLEGAINTLTNDLNFYLLYQSTFNTNGASKLRTTRDRMIKLGILVDPDKDGIYAYASVVPGSEPVIQRLTNYEQQQIRELNYHALKYVLFPDAIYLSINKPYVSPRVTDAKTWDRDVYHYNASGALTGWTRYTADDREEFTTGAQPDPNQPPVVEAGADQTITLSTEATLAGTVSDDALPNPPQQVTVTWSKVSGPGDVIFSNANAANTTVRFTSVGSYVLRLTASDSDLTSSDEVTITVNKAANNSPIINSFTNTAIDRDPVIEGIQVYEGDTVTYKATASDPDGDTIDWTWYLSMNGAADLQRSSGQNAITDEIFSYPKGSVGATYNFILRVTDGDATVSDEVTVNVIAPPNNPPTINAGDDQTITLPADATLNATASDDGLPATTGALSFIWSKVSGLGTVTFSDEHAANTTASFSEAGTYVLHITVDDSDLSASDEVTITVRTEATPSVTPTPDQGQPEVTITAPTDQATVSGVVAVTASATDNEAVIGVQFLLDGAPLGAEDTQAPYAASWDTTSVTDGVYALTAVARDAQGNSTTSAPVQVIINRPPTITFTPDQEVYTFAPNQTLVLTITANDVNGSPLTLDIEDLQAILPGAVFK